MFLFLYDLTGFSLQQDECIRFVFDPQVRSGERQHITLANGIASRSIPADVGSHQCFVERTSERRLDVCDTRSLKVAQTGFNIQKTAPLLFCTSRIDRRQLQICCIIHPPHHRGPKDLSKLIQIPVPANPKMFPPITGGIR